MGHTYRELRVWQESVEMSIHAYRLTQPFPQEELYGLSNQIRRSAVSVSSNIAEGQGRLSKKDFRHFLSQARGSLFEMETQFVIASRLGYLSDSSLKAMLKQSGAVNAMLSGLMQSMLPPTEQRET
ncbi:MAG: four helix bundle protein [Terriglobales bacterium]